MPRHSAESSHRCNLLAYMYVSVTLLCCVASLRLALVSLPGAVLLSLLLPTDAESASLPTQLHLWLMLSQLTIWL